MLSMVKAPAEPGVGEEEFRNALRLFASGVTVVTTLDPLGKVHGMTATAFTSLSLDPPLVLVAVGRGTRCHRLVSAARRFGISILSSRQNALSRHFGGRPKPAFEPRYRRLDGLAVLDEALVSLACDLEDVVAGGDHSIFIGRVAATCATSGEPLIHFEGRYRALSKDMD